MSADTETTWDDASTQDDWINPPPSNGHSSNAAYKSLFDAPPLSDFVKQAKTAEAREYEARAQAFLKALMMNAIAKEQYADAATYITYGPGAASATGYLAAADEHAKKLIDFVTSPANPYVMFGLAIAPMVAQLFRNHEAELSQLPNMRRKNRAQRKAAKAARAAQPQAEAQVKIKIPFLRREIPVRVNFKKILPHALDGFRAQTTDPQTLTDKVFSDEKLIKELRKQGIHVGMSYDD